MVLPVCYIIYMCYRKNGCEIELYKCVGVKYAEYQQNKRRTSKRGERLKNQRRNLEKKFKKTHERLELAMDAGEHGFWDWNLDTNDIYFSPRYFTMLGYEPGELPMKLETWVNLMHPDDKKTIVPEVENYVKNSQAYEVEFRLKTKDG